jgi:Na+/H+ antiporter NhaD/arsenite permease-like protein
MDIPATEAAHAAASGNLYWIACGIFVLSFALIISEKVHKTKVALFGAAATIVIGVLTQVEAFHSTVVGVDYNVIFLLIAMMLIVNILGKSGAFEWTAVRLAKVAKGDPVKILVFFFVATAAISAGLDNVTTVLLFAPVTLRICDELGLDPVPYLILEAIASNIGGTATLIGDPPNLIVASRAQLTFNDFIIHLTPIVIIMMIVFTLVVRYVFRNRFEADPVKKARILAMDETGLIKNRPLLIKAGWVLALTIVGFVAHDALHLEPATIALFGAALLLLISGIEPHDVLAEVEWPTIFFFIGLFIIIGGIVKVGLVSDLSQFVIQATAPTSESMFATSMVILWFSGFLSAFIDNIPYVATMAPLVGEMASNVVGGGDPALAGSKEVLQHAAVMPVWWALALGACLGGNGTAIGASANVVVLGLAERGGRKITFLQFMKYGMPIMIGSLIMSTAYLWIRYYL